MERALADARPGGAIHGGERMPGREIYVRPALVEMPAADPVVLRETFAPSSWMRFSDLGEAMRASTTTPPGLSSAIATNDDRRGQAKSCSVAGSDCGIANVNIGPAGAEGRRGVRRRERDWRWPESVSSWKAYSRRTTNTVNYGRTCRGPGVDSTSTRTPRAIKPMAARAGHRPTLRPGAFEARPAGEHTRHAGSDRQNRVGSQRAFEIGLHEIATALSTRPAIKVMLLRYRGCRACQGCGGLKQDQRRSRQRRGRRLAQAELQAAADAAIAAMARSIFS